MMSATFPLDFSVGRASVIELELDSPITGDFAVYGDSDSAPLAHGFATEPTRRIVALVRRIDAVRVTIADAATPPIIRSVTKATPSAKVRTAELTNGQRPFEVRGGDIAMLTAKPGVDIIDKSSFEQAGVIAVEPSGVFLGSGWHPRETEAGNPLRWLSSAGEIAISRPETPGGHILQVQCSPGPCLGTGDASLVLSSRETGKVLGMVSVNSPNEYLFRLGEHDLTSPLNHFVLTVENPLPVHYDSDPRELNVRVDGLTLHKDERPPRDIAFARGWTAEDSPDGPMRWLYEYGDLEVAYSGEQSEIALCLDVKPGPCLDLVSNVLQLLRPDGSKLSEVTVKAAGVIVLPLPDVPNGDSRVTLRLVNPTPRVFEDDDRALNLQIGTANLLPLAEALAAQRRQWNSFADDVTKSGKAAATVQFSPEWNVPEHFDGETFRWMGESAQLFLRPAGDRHLELHFLAGPDFDPEGHFELRAANGAVVANPDLSTGSGRVVLDLDELPGDEPLVLAAHASVRKGLGEDREDVRTLAVRLMSIRSAEPGPNPFTENSEPLTI